MGPAPGPADTPSRGGGGRGAEGVPCCGEGVGRLPPLPCAQRPSPKHISDKWPLCLCLVGTCPSPGASSSALPSRARRATSSRTQTSHGMRFEALAPLKDGAWACRSKWSSISHGLGPAPRWGWGLRALQRLREVQGWPKPDWTCQEDLTGVGAASPDVRRGWGRSCLLPASACRAKREAAGSVAAAPSSGPWEACCDGCASVPCGWGAASSRGAEAVQEDFLFCLSRPGCQFRSPAADGRRGAKECEACRKKERTLQRVGGVGGRDPLCVCGWKSPPASLWGGRGLGQEAAEPA